MTIHRIIPNLNVDDATTGHDFYSEFLGLRKEFDLGWVASFRSPTNPSVQVSIVAGDPTAAEPSSLTVAVSDVDAFYTEAQVPRAMTVPTFAGVDRKECLYLRRRGNTQRIS